MMSWGQDPNPIGLVTLEEEKEMLDFSLHHIRVQSKGSHLWARKRALMRNQIDQHLEFQPPEMWERSFCYYLSHLVCSILSWQPKQTNRRERSERLRSCFKGTHWPNLGQLELQNEWTDSHFSCSVMSDSLQPCGLQQVRLPCPSPTPGAYLNSCPSCWWCHPTISSSVIPLSSCLQSFPTSGSFPRSQLFASGGQSIGVWALALVLPMNIQGWFPLG